MMKDTKKNTYTKLTQCRVEKHATENFFFIIIIIFIFLYIDFTKNILHKNKVLYKKQMMVLFHKTRECLYILFFEKLQLHRYLTVQSGFDYVTDINWSPFNATVFGYWCIFFNFFFIYMGCMM